MSARFPIPEEKGRREGTVTSYEACRIRFHAVSFLVIGTDGVVVVHQGREFNRTRWNIILSNFSLHDQTLPSKWSVARRE